MALFDFLFKQNQDQRSNEKKPNQNVPMGLTLSSAVIPFQGINSFYELYYKNADLKVAIDKVASNIAKGGFDVVNQSGEPITDKEVSDVINNIWGIKQIPWTLPFLEWKFNLFINYLISWNAFLYILRNDTGKMIWLQVLDSRFVTKVVREDWTVIMYTQNINGTLIEIPPEDIKHLQDWFDIYNESLWMSKLNGLLVDIVTDKSAAESNLAYFQNSAVPWNLIVFEQWATNEEINTTMGYLKKMFKGGKNKHKTAALQGVKEIIKVQDSFKDQQFIDLRSANLERYLRVFWVPKSIASVTDGVNYATSHEQTKNFYQETINPYEVKLEKAINQVLVAEGFRSLVDIQTTSVWLSPDQRKAVLMEVDMWVRTPNEYRQEIWLEQYDSEEASQLRYKWGEEQNEIEETV